MKHPPIRELGLTIMWAKVAHLSGAVKRQN